MKQILSIFTIVLFFSGAVSAQNNSSEATWGVEAGLLYLNQSSGGDTTTVLPMLNGRLWHSGPWGLNAQVGATVYKDANSDKTFSIGVFRLNPLYQIADTKFSLEGLLGVQKWEDQDAKADLGLRLNYGFESAWLSELFVGGGSVQQDETTNYLTLGLKKWF
ncbi:hypothetical protein D3C87_1093460 [compost metagenome]